MNPESITSTTKLCPTCGTRVALDAKKCLVCGADLGYSENSAQSAKVVQGSRMPTVTLNLPSAIGLLALFLAIGAVLVLLALRQTPEVIAPLTPTSSSTTTFMPTDTPTELPPTQTTTPEPSPTPITYMVREADTCIDIAAFFKVSVQSIVTLNNLPAACDNLSIGQSLLIPQPTPTITPLPTATLSSGERTEAACEKIEYVVQQEDTLGSISSNYGVPMDAIREENGLTGDTVFLGQEITIPLCRRFATPGPSPTPTPPPPYTAPNPLLPADGAPFTSSDDTITLQWASVGTLRDNEAYAVTIIDVTAGTGEKLIDYVNDTKYIIPNNLRPNDNVPHVFRWWVGVVRQVGTDEDGNPLWEDAGAMSVIRDFSWTNTVLASTPEP
jgi:LysM repeat protein